LVDVTLLAAVDFNEPFDGQRGQLRYSRRVQLAHMPATGDGMVGFVSRALPDEVWDRVSGGNHEYILVVRGVFFDVNGRVAILTRLGKQVANPLRDLLMPECPFSEEEAAVLFQAPWRRDARILAGSELVEEE